MKTQAEHAADVLRETKNPAIMWGDVGLAHMVRERAGLPHRGVKTCDLVLNALEGSPLFDKQYRMAGNVRVRCFFLKNGS